MASVLLLYHSQEHGNTAAMAKSVAEGARAAGAEVTLINTNEARLDIDRYRAFDAAAFGSPDYYSYIAGGLKVFLDDWHIAKQRNPENLENKPYALFYSHGGGGAVRGPLESLFSGIGTKVGETIESRGRPNKAILEACWKLGEQLAQSAKDKPRKK
jgi:NAD(P)H dehydrogenase (quinone)